MHTVVETQQYLRHAKDCDVTEGERQNIVNFIAANPKAGDEMPGTGGMRKLRFARPGGGKSGGYRVITFYSGTDIPVFLLSIYAKNVKKDVSENEKSILKKLAKSLPTTYGKEER